MQRHQGYFILQLPGHSTVTPDSHTLRFYQVEQVKWGDACRPSSWLNRCYLPGPKNGAKNVSGMPLRPSAQTGITRFAPDVPPI